MAEDLENTLKPKVTLIKQQKKPEHIDVPEAVAEDKSEKKKVVVVKKKVLLKKPQARVVARKDEDHKGDEAEQASAQPREEGQAGEAHAAAHGAHTAQETQAESAESEKAKPATRADHEGHAQAAVPAHTKTILRPASDKPEGERKPAPQGQDRQPWQPSVRPDRVAGNLDRRSSGYQGSREGVYQGQRPSGPGYQGSREGGSGYQGQRPSGPGYQGSREGGGGYQGQRPSGPGYQGGYQGNREGGSGYQGQRPSGPGYQGGYQGSREGGSGYQGQRPSGPGYQGGYQGQRPGGYQGGYQGQRPQGPGGRPGYGPRPGGPSRTGGPGGSSPSPLAGKGPAKKFIKAKRPVYQKNKDEEQSEKLLQLKKKQSAIKANPIPKEIDIMESISVAELAKKMNLKASDLIAKLFSMGMMVTINQSIDADTATILAGEYGCEVHKVSLYDETVIEKETDKPEDLRHRNPIVTVMGHVDHGKTKLLDAIRKTNVVATEFGGITQHIGAYTVDTGKGGITFLDTPGHEAFTLMRARGAQITDIVILVVAANDGVMPQTVEALNHAKEAKVPIIVAINKCDLPEANPDRVKNQLSELGLIPEAWGGQTIFAEISALQKKGITELLDSILLQAEVLELTANYDCRAEGKVLESKIEHGRGIVATVIIERGTLRIGDSFVAGTFAGKVRAVFTDHGEKIEEAYPSMPIEIIGLEGIPNAGDPFQVTESDKYAKQIAGKRQELMRSERAQTVKKITLDNLYDTIQEGAVQELKVVLKGDVQGSVEAVKASLEKLSTNEVRLNVIHASAGTINENDVNLASASNALIIGFNVRPTPKAKALADQEKVDIRKYNIIYRAVEEIQLAMEGMLTPEYKEQDLGSAEVRNTFKVPKIGIIAGCYITEGKVRRNCGVHVIRDGIELMTGKISSLKRFKDDVKEVDTGYECGIGVENCSDLQVGDVLEVFEMIQVVRTLSDGKGNVGTKEKAN